MCSSRILFLARLEIEMVNDTLVSVQHTWLLVLCTIVVSFSLAAPLITESPGGLPDPGALPCSGAEGDLADWTETCEQKDSVMPPGAGSAQLHSVTFLLTISDPAGWTWFPTPPVRPPILSNSL